MEVTFDVSKNPSSLHASKSDSSMFFCQPKQEEQKPQQHDTNLSIQDDQMMINTNKNQVKKPVSFPFGKW
jgi:hypothetical protein